MRQDQAKRPAWEPLVEGKIASTILECIDASSHFFERSIPADGSASAFAERALLFCYLHLARLERSPKWRELSIAYLNHSIDILSSDQPVTSVSLYSGCAEIGWIIQHVQSALEADDFCDKEESDAIAQGHNNNNQLNPPDHMDFSRSGIEDPVEAIDALIIHNLSTNNFYRQYTLHSGVVGFGIYALARLPQPSAVHIANLVVQHLSNTSLMYYPGRAWPTFPSEGAAAVGHTRETYDSTMLHGASGVVVFLTGACGWNIDLATSSRMLHDVVAWLISQIPFHEFALPPMTQIEKRLTCDYRNGWCSGRAGVARALQLAAKRTLNPYWAIAADDILKSVPTHVLGSSKPVEAGLCHGALGISQIYNRSWQEYHYVGHKQAAVEWLRVALHLLGISPSASGRSTILESRLDTPDDDSFLSGRIGITLALLATITSVAPNWDRILGMSCREDQQPDRDSGLSGHTDTQATTLRSLC